LYATWAVLWVVFSAFVICFYAEAFGLSRQDDWLALGTGSFSWWLENG
jgi:hypothetical protein